MQLETNHKLITALVLAIDYLVERGVSDNNPEIEEKLANLGKTYSELPDSVADDSITPKSLIEYCIEVVEEYGTHLKEDYDEQY